MPTISERLAGKQILGVALASRRNNKNGFRLTIILRSKSDARANERVSVLAWCNYRQDFAQWRKDTEEKNRVAQDRRSELIFYFLKFGEEKFTAVDFFAVAETQKIWLARGL